MIDLSEQFHDAGITGAVHARLVRGGRDEVGHRADDPVAMASVYKLPLALAWADLVDRGELDPFQRLELSTEHRTPGATGVSLLLDRVELSARDTVRQMLTSSDNAAADRILALVGLDAVAAWLRAAGLGHTTVRGGTSEALARVRSETGRRGFRTSMEALADPDTDVRTSEYDSLLASATTARDMTTLLSGLWTDAGGPAARTVRDALGQQVWTHRLRSGFPHDDVQVAAKTGTMGRLRHEVGVVTFPGEFPVAVAVFTQAARAAIHLPDVDRAIGAIARTAVTALRRPLSAS